MGEIAEKIGDKAKRNDGGKWEMINRKNKRINSKGRKIIWEKGKGRWGGGI